jgi:dihydrofolate reductase
MTFDVVVAADLEWGIGNASGLPWPKLPGDLAHFKRITSAAPDGRRNAIVMGRKTWESTEVGGKPLPKRVNIVVSRQPLTVPDGVVVAASLDDALAVGAREIGCFVVGGAAIYRLAFAHPALRYIYLTRVEGRFACDTHIPDLDAAGFTVDPSWEGACESLENGVAYRIERLRVVARSTTSSTRGREAT